MDHSHLMDIRRRAAEPSDAPAMARVYVDASRSAFAGIVPSKFLEDLSHRKAESRWNQVLADQQTDRRTFVGETHDGKVVGLA